MNTFEDKVVRLRRTIEAQTNTPASVHVGPKYTRLDIGSSGRYMVVNATGVIHGIKGYGQIHPKHTYGTLDTIDQWDWSGYRAVKKIVPQVATAERTTASKAYAKAREETDILLARLASFLESKDCREQSWGAVGSLNYFNARLREQISQLDGTCE